jgi:hypothetical protein
LVFLLKRLDKVVLISKEEYDIFKNKYGFNENKLELIYNPIDIDLINLKLQENISNEFDYLFSN